MGTGAGRRGDGMVSGTGTGTGTEAGARGTHSSVWIEISLTSGLGGGARACRGSTTGSGLGDTGMNSGSSGTSVSMATEAYVGLGVSGTSVATDTEAYTGLETVACTSVSTDDSA